MIREEPLPDEAPASSGHEIVLVENWLAELQRLVPLD